ncbi:MAG TPA: hypothetical protein VGP53_05335, partial [Acidimicrobiales bacterium]|nr:hypothetical protein [Acidimicrobiales bacterium]
LMQVKPSGDGRLQVAAGADCIDDRPDNRSSTLTGLLVFVAPLILFGAIALEIAAGEGAADPTSSGRSWVPLTWPAPLRAIYWLAIGALAFGHRIGLARLGSTPRPAVTLAITAPFVVFAAGITLGAPWATWH